MMQLALEVGQTAKPEAVMFWILGPMAVVAALGMLLVKKAASQLSILHTHKTLRKIPYHTMTK
mgnify:CR=1 FL=1